MTVLQLLPALLAVISSSVNGQDVGYVEECPEKFGFYADAVQCDRYYECKDGQILDHYCPDGLVFDETSTNFAKCSFPFSVDCKDRPELQKARPTKLCPRQNGYFAHEDPAACDKFYFCVDGVANPITCPDTLIFDPSKGQCAFSDQVKNRKGCSSEEFFQFKCPRNSQSNHEHPRYPDEKDCQFFYICIDGVEPRRNGCTVGLVFNPETLSCDRPQNVNGPCRTWYNETFLEQVAPPVRPAVGSSVQLSDQANRRVPARRRRPTQSVLDRPQATREDQRQAVAGVDLFGSPLLESSGVSSFQETRIPAFAGRPVDEPDFGGRFEAQPALPEPLPAVPETSEPVREAVIPSFDSRVTLPDRRQRPVNPEPEAVDDSRTSLPRPRHRQRRPRPRPRPAAPAAPSAAVEEQGSNPSSFESSRKVPLRNVAQSSNAFAAQRKRVRTRVRTRVRPRPVAQPEPEASLGEIEETPQQIRTTGARVPSRASPSLSSSSSRQPSFALSSDEDIQRFRQQNRFVPESSPSAGSRSRLTILSNGSRRRPQPAAEPVQEDEQDFAAFAAVPSRGGLSRGGSSQFENFGY